MKDVHTEHCCIRHGCKYGDEDCTVTSGEKHQSYLCEDCRNDEEMGLPYSAAPHLLAALKKLLSSAHDSQPGIEEAEEAIAKAEGRS